MARLKARVQDRVNPEGTPERPHRFLALPAMVAALAFAVYVPTLSAGWTSTDDTELIVEDAPFLTSEGAVRRAFERPFFPQANRRSYYRPLVTASFAMDASRAATQSPAPYHLTNVLIHVATSVLVFLFARALGVLSLGATGAALLFAVHPVTPQAVAWIPGRCDGLLAIFSLGALLAWVRFDSAGSRRALGLHHALLVAALFSKEAAVAIPVLALSYTALVTRASARVRDPLVWIGWLAATLVWFFARKHAIGATDLVTMARTFVRNAPALVVGFGKLLVPVELDVLATLRDSSLVPGVVAVGLLIAGAVIIEAKERRRYLWAVFVFPTAVLVPALGVSDFLILDNRLYLPLAGVAVGLLPLLEGSLERRGFARAGRAMFAVASVGVATWTIERERLFESPSAFCDAGVEGSPHLALAYLNRGAVEYHDHQVDEARRDFERALAEDPSQTVAHNDLGLIFLNSGELGRAETEFEMELSRNPNYSKAHFNLGLVYERTGRVELARDQFETVVALRPTDTDAWGELLVYWGPRDADRAEAIQKKMESLGVQFFSPQ